MKIVKILGFLLLAGGLLSNGCTHFLGFHGRYKVPELKPSDEIPDPRTEFFRLKEFLEKNDGNITDQTDEIVKWKDTRLFRLYEFEDYTVIIFPYNWSDTLFDVYFIAGHMKGYENLLDDIYTYHPVGGGKFIDDYRTFNINADMSSERKIGLYGIFLGMPREEIKDFFLKKVQAKCLKDKFSNAETLKELDYYKHLYSKSEKMDLKPLHKNLDDTIFECRFLDNKLVWMRIRALRASLSDYGLFKYKLPVIREGEFSTSEEASSSDTKSTDESQEHEDVKTSEQ